VASACRYFIDKLLRTAEKDADFVFRGSSAYKGTTETRKTKSLSPLEKQGALMAFVNYNISLFNRQSLFFVTLCYDFSAFCAFFDSLKATPSGWLF